MNAPDSHPDRQRRISEIAHRIWESEGCPSGQAERHWQMAEKLVLAEEKQAAARKPKPDQPKPDEPSPENKAPAGKPAVSKLSTSKPVAKKSPAPSRKRDR